jgi:glycylpeptide N-tetradecanoyltransferase
MMESKEITSKLSVQKAALPDSHRFWSTQPVPQDDEQIDKTVNEPIEADKPCESIRQQPYTLPEGFHWCMIRLDVESEMQELYELLAENYVEDDDSMFRFNYSPDFLKWALEAPGFVRDWHVGVRITSSGKLMGFISAVPATICINYVQKSMVEINFLCVHKKLRSKRLAPVLIKEITRRVNLTGIFQATYTAGSVLPHPITSCRYYHRSLNFKKLAETGFAPMPRNMSLAKIEKKYQLPNTTKLAGLRPFRIEDDLDQVMEQMHSYLNRFKIHPQFSREEFAHYFTPAKHVMYSYVVEHFETKKITAFASFYALSSAVLRFITTSAHSKLDIAYLYYYFSDDHSLEDLILDLLILAKNEGFDVFNCLTLMDNKSFLDSLDFKEGDGMLQFYLYNWKCATMEPEHVGLVLL